jgi:type II secretory pathway pseudopilin PulG
MRSGERGFTLVVVLVLLAVCMLGLSVAGPMWSQHVRREREQELLRVGALYAQALQDYYTSSPGSVPQFPQRLEDLLTDTRFVGIRHHLRQLYPDPIDPSQPWGLVLDAQQHIIGVYSRSERAPLAQGPQAAQHYSDWKFTAKVKS